MNLEMITNTGDVEHENIVCLTHYSKDDILSFSEEIKDKIINKSHEIVLHKSSYIKAINCALTLKKSDVDKGIYLTNGNNLICELKEESYINIIEIAMQFLNDKSHGFYWLIDIDNTEFDFLMNDIISW
jgi:hypothetical protein